ncbi:hypothetical protein SHO565_39070 [Streptomyces sp. HO565]
MSSTVRVAPARNASSTGTVRKVTTTASAAPWDADPPSASRRPGASSTSTAIGVTFGLLPSSPSGFRDRASIRWPRAPPSVITRLPTIPVAPSTAIVMRVLNPFNPSPATRAMLDVLGTGPPSTAP